MSGGLGDVACFSFYASKTLTSGEGGLLVTNDHTIAERAKIIRNQGFEGDGRTYVHRLMGFNYRLTNIQAAIALAQCERVREKVERKRQIRQQYEALLGKERGIIDVCISNVLFET
jgi:perosamine synthetase